MVSSSEEYDFVPFTEEETKSSIPEIFERLPKPGPSAGRLTAHASLRTARSWAATAG